MAVHSSGSGFLGGREHQPLFGAFFEEGNEVFTCKNPSSPFQAVGRHLDFISELQRPHKGQQPSLNHGIPELLAVLLQIIQTLKVIVEGEL